MRFKEFSNLPVLDAVFVTSDGSGGETLHEGKWIAARFNCNIRIDQPTHGVGQTHAHVLGRKGEEIGVVNIDGTGSHGTKCRLSQQDADALRAKGFEIKPGNIVEWLSLETEAIMFLLG